jgi:carboxy-terminal domain RNA polymerase II polypeptide A small phosphatase
MQTTKKLGRRVQSHGYPIERITILADSPEKIVLQPRNHLRVKPYYGLEEDRELLAVAEELVVRSK